MKLGSLVLALLLAGCATPSDVGTGSPSDTVPPVEPAPATMAFPQCQDVTGHFQVPATAMEGDVPAPLRLSTDATGTLADLWIIAAECDAARLPDGTAVATVRLALAGVRVLAPAAPGPDNSTVSWGYAILDVGATDAAVATTFARWGQANAKTADISFSVTGDGTARVAEATWGSEPWLRVVAGPQAPFGDDKVRFFLLGPGEVAGAIDWNVTAGFAALGTAMSPPVAGRGGWFGGEGYGYGLQAVPVHLLGFDKSDPRPNP